MLVAITPCTRNDEAALPFINGSEIHLRTEFSSG